MGNNIVSSLGAGSGIDIKGLVEGLMAVERAAPEQRLDKKEEKFEAQISAYGTLKSSMEEFKKVLDPLTNPDLFGARSATFPSNNEFITANSLNPDAQTGTFDIEVIQTAKSQSLASASVDDPKKQLLLTGDADETVTVNFGAWNPAGTVFSANADKESLDITIKPGQSSLQDIADLINEENSGLQATVLDDGLGQSKLLLTSPSGESNEVQVQVSNNNGSDKLSMIRFDGTAGGMDEKQGGQDAKLKVNGLDIQRASNTMDDVVKGFDFTLNKASAGEVVTFSIEQDRGTSEQAIRDFVEAYNAFAEAAKNLTGTTKDEETGKTKSGSLSADGSAKSMVSTLLGSRSNKVPGLSGDFTLLATIGVVTERDGSLTIDEEIFTGALKDNYDKVSDLFSRSTSSSNSAIGVAVRPNMTPSGAEHVIEVTQEPTKATAATGATGLAFPLDLTNPAKDYSFQFDVHGEKTETITLDQSYASAEDFASALQVAINSDPNVAKVGVGITVAINAGTGALTFESEGYGKVSNTASIGFVDGQTSADFTLDLFDPAGMTETAGLGVKGTVDGELASGSGQYLFPVKGEPGYGLRFQVGPGTLGEKVTIGFSNGFAGELITDINTFLADEGVIDKREERMNEGLEKITEDREALETRMSKIEIRYFNQFLAMESIINSLNSSLKQVTSLIDTLPFTAQNN